MDAALTQRSAKGDTRTFSAQTVVCRLAAGPPPYSLSTLQSRAGLSPPLLSKVGSDSACHGANHRGHSPRVSKGCLEPLSLGLRLGECLHGPPQSVLSKETLLRDTLPSILLPPHEAEGVRGSAVDLDNMHLRLAPQLAGSICCILVSPEHFSFEVLLGVQCGCPTARITAVLGLEPLPLGASRIQRGRIEMCWTSHGHTPSLPLTSRRPPLLALGVVRVLGTLQFQAGARARLSQLCTGLWKLPTSRGHDGDIILACLSCALSPGSVPFSRTCCHWVFLP